MQVLSSFKAQRPFVFLTFSCTEKHIKALISDNLHFHRDHFLKSPIIFQMSYGFSLSDNQFHRFNTNTHMLCRKI